MGSRTVVRESSAEGICHPASGRVLGPLAATALVMVVVFGCGGGGPYARNPGLGGTNGATGGSLARDGGADAAGGGGSGGIIIEGSGGGGAAGMAASGGAGGRPGTGGEASGGSGPGGMAAGGKNMSTGSGGGVAGAPGGRAGGSGGTAGRGTGGLPGVGGTSGTGSGGSGSGGVAGSGPGPSSGGAGGGGVATGGAGMGGSGSGGVAGPPIISVDFVGGGPGGAPGTVVMDQTEVAGVKRVSRWNSAPGAAGSLSSLTLADGTTVTASLSWRSPVAGSAVGTWQVGYTDQPGDTRMMNGYLDPGEAGMPAVVTVSGLPASFIAGGYDVYVYVAASIPSGTRTYGYAIGPSAFTVTEAGPTGTTFPGFVQASNGGSGNYVVFRRIGASSFTLTATPGTGPGTQTRAPVNGIQIVAPTGS